MLLTDLLIYLTNFLNLRDVGRLKCVSKRFKKIYNTEMVWRILTIKYYYPKICEDFIAPNEYFSRQLKFYGSFNRSLFFFYSLGYSDTTRFRITAKKIKGNLITILNCKRVEPGDIFDFIFPYETTRKGEKYYGSHYLIWTHDGKYLSSNNHLRNLVNDLSRDLAKDESPCITISFLEEVKENFEDIINLPPNSLLILNHAIIANYKLVKEKVPTPTFDFPLVKWAYDFHERVNHHINKN